MQPSVKIGIIGGQLGRTVQLNDGVAGLIVTGIATDQLALHEPVQLFSVKEARDLGITLVNKRLGYDLNITTAGAGVYSVFMNTTLIGSVTAVGGDTPADVETALISAINAGSGSHGFQAANVSGVVRITKVSTAVVTEEFSFNTPTVAAFTVADYVTTTDNSFAETHIIDFYAQAGNGKELWVMLVPDSETIADLVDINQTDHAVKLLDATDNIRLLGVAVKPAIGYTFTPVQGIDANVIDAVTKAQELAAYYQSVYKPFNVLLDGIGFLGNVATLHNLRGGSEKQYVSVVLGSSDALVLKSRTIGGQLLVSNAVGLLLGRLAGIPVQRNAGRVRSGDVGLLNAYIGAIGVNARAVSAYQEGALDSLNDKGYIFLRKHIGLNGFYWVDDHTATPITSDFAYINRVRVIEKARLIARATLLQELLDEIPLDPDTGQLGANYIASFKASVETAINAAMTANGEIVAVECNIDPNQNILATDTLLVSILITPVGIARQIEATLAFAVNV